ncbi:hypothetical protein A3Q56_02864 [Intoshia linei]|uniref:EF-hand domain-containing protein n=1 Tax=Intoshia linei TaxID=1819745 RepID=A0A177B4Z2_9BILA|nr:hypothetical protein A3Q56_02864 [Intoshia linei]
MDEFNTLVKIIFNIFDKVDDVITIQSMSEIMNWLEPSSTEAEIQDIVNSFDENGDGFIDFGEFSNGIKPNFKEKIKENELRACFEIFDQNKDGKLDIKDIFYSLKQLKYNINNTHTIKKIFKKYDKDQKHYLTYEERG